MKIILKNISKIFKGRSNQTVVLKDFSTTLSKNHSYAIIGRSGCGKSTLLQIISGIDKSFSGFIEFTNDEKEISRPKFGLIFQTDYLISTLSLMENVCLGSIIKGNSTKKAWQASEELLDKVGLSDKKHFFPSELSFGQRARGSIARAVITNPDFIIADEPTANLDNKSADQVITLLLELKEEFGIGLIIATHDTILANKLDNKILLEENPS